MRSVKTVPCRTQEWDFYYNPYSMVTSQIRVKQKLHLSTFITFRPAARVWAILVKQVQTMVAVLEAGVEGFYIYIIF